MRKYKADIGIALDGDADRVIMCDEKSQIIDGDQIIAMIASRWKRKKILKGGVIGTLMSNYGLEKFFLNENERCFLSLLNEGIYTPSKSNLVASYILFVKKNLHFLFFKNFLSFKIVLKLSLEL